MDYLVLSDGSSGGGSSSDGGSSDGGGGGGLSKGDHAVTTADLNLRYDASFTAGVAAVAPEGTVVKITGGADNGFYPVDWDGLKGFMSGDYLSATDEDLSQRGGSGAPGGDGGGVSGGGGGGGSATGEAIANYAMQYLGYPYVWATHGPSSFDCSGFTYWVVLNTLGIDIGTGLWTQVAAGSSVSQSNLQPGDLVFFQNTFEWGLSHVGIYIGNGQFIHAENESTGVVISSLSSSYYSSRWYGAVRLA
jgi:cell wall-associated NlpC family hydrolase